MKGILVLLAMGSIHLSGCGGNSDVQECGIDTSCAPFPAEDIVGLWDRSESVEGASEVLYTYIGAEGTIYNYDFQQDEFGNGDNCFLLSSGFITRVAVASSDYDVVIEDDIDSVGISERLTIVQQGSNLLVKRANSIEEIWPLLVGVDRADLLLC